MKVRIIARSGYHDRFGNDHACGATVELPDRIAVKLITYHIAEAVREAPIERAVKTPPETVAVKPKTKARRSSRPTAKGKAE